MPTTAILERVRELQAELAETQPDAPGAVQETGNLKQALDTVLLAPAESEQYTALRDQLLLAYAGFEVAYPKLAGAMQGLIAELTAAGL